jgi:hypothetical protein
MAVVAVISISIYSIYSMACVANASLNIETFIESVQMFCYYENNELEAIKTYQKIMTF